VAVVQLDQHAQSMEHLVFVLQQVPVKVELMQVIVQALQIFNAVSRVRIIKYLMQFYMNNKFIQ